MTQTQWGGGGGNNGGGVHHVDKKLGEGERNLTKKGGGV